jgi:LDH2 family malate/lactate/ureidoglycolate dehydrogenase
VPTVSADRLLVISRRIFEAAGTPADLAEIVSDHLINANLAGHDSHGVIRIPSYVQTIKRGQLDPAARPSTLEDRGPTIRVDGNWAFGQVAARYAIDLAIARAKEVGVALVGIVHANHIGRVGEYPTLAAERGVAAFVTVGGLGQSVAPHGGRKGGLGTNPISFGFPAASHPPFLVDFATSAIAGGKVMVARAKSEPLPPGSLIDADGRPSQDANQYFAGGALLPFGAHKGYGLSLGRALFSGVLTQAAHADGGRGGRGGGVLMLAIDAGVFGPAERAVADADALMEKIKAVPPAEGVAEVLVPGEPEARSRQRRGQEGVPVPESTWKEIGETAASLGVTMDG